MQTLTVKLEDGLLQDLATLQCFRLSTRFAPPLPPSLWPQLSVSLEVNGLHVVRDTDKLLTLNTLSFDLDVSHYVYIQSISHVQNSMQLPYRLLKTPVNQTYCEIH